MGNAVCRNFLFPLGWPACGLNSTLAGPPTLPAGWVAQLRRRRGAKRQATTVNERERERGGGVVEGSGDEQEGNGAAHREALASTVRDQMTRASAHNNGLFTLRSDPIPIQAPPPRPLSHDTPLHDRGSRIKLMVNSWPPWLRDGLAVHFRISGILYVAIFRITL